MKGPCHCLGTATFKEARNIKFFFLFFFFSKICCCSVANSCPVLRGATTLESHRVSQETEITMKTNHLSDQLVPQRVKEMTKGP